MKNKISQFRKTNNLTQRQLGDMLNMPYQAIQRYELGIRTPAVDTAIRLAKALNTTVEELFVLDN